MLVTEAKIFSPSVMKITVTNTEGVRWVSDVNSDATIDELKVLAASHFYSPSESVKASMFKLVHVKSCRSLTEERTATQEGVNTGDELLLIQKRMPPSQTEPPDGHRKGPDQATIDNLTKHITPRNTSRLTHEAPTVLDFQAELRKILISLIDAAQKLLCLNPKASQILKQAEEMLDEKTSTQPEVDPDALSQLKDMGFTEPRAKKALILNGMLPTEAMDWLLQHEDDPDIDTPLPGMEEIVSDSDKDTSEGATGTPVAQTTEGAKVCNILTSFRRYKKRSFNPNPIALRKLIEMGFEEKDVIEALRVNGNHQNLSCEWLLNPDRKRTNMEDIDKGLDIEGPIYRAIMENPAVQLGLNNPRSLLAFLEMIENPNSTTRWLNDPDTGPMLIQISRIYHSEKHAAGDDKAPSS